MLSVAAISLSPEDFFQNFAQTGTVVLATIRELEILRMSRILESLFYTQTIILEQTMHAQRQQ